MSKSSFSLVEKFVKSKFKIRCMIQWTILIVITKISLHFTLNKYKCTYSKQMHAFYLLMNWSVSSVILSPSYFSSPYFGLGIFELGGLVEQFEFVASKTLLKVSGQDLTSSVIIEVSCWIIEKNAINYIHFKLIFSKLIVDQIGR